MGLPTISVTFKKLASSAVTRSTRGVLAVIVQDATNAAFTTKSYSAESEVSSGDYTAANYAAICRAFAAAPYKVIVVRIGTDGDIDAAAAILDTISYNWVCAVPATLQSGLVTYVKAANTASRVRKVKALVCGVSAADDMHIVNVPNTTVTLSGASETTDMNLYLPRLAAVLAACPMTESVTYYALDDLAAAAAVADVGASVDGGNMALFKDDQTIRIARGVNTVTTVSGDITAEMKKITIVEGMDIMQEDIISTFKTTYLGKFKNNADNQALFVSAVQSYFAQLEREEVLDGDSDNAVEVDIAAQKAAWTAAGTDTTEWTDAYAKKKTYTSNVYLSATVRILDAMEDLKFVIGMA